MCNRFKEGCPEACTVSKRDSISTTVTLSMLYKLHIKFADLPWPINVILRFNFSNFLFENAEIIMSLTQ